MLVTRDILDALYGRCRVPLFRFPTPDAYNAFADPYGLGGMASNVRGRFVLQGVHANLPNSFIAIIQNQPLVGELMTYFHELGHYKHFTGGCECTEDPGILAEIHANEYALRGALKEGYLGAVRWEMLLMSGINGTSDLAKFVIIDRLKKLPIWSECLLALGHHKIKGETQDYKDAVRWLRPKRKVVAG